MQRILFPAAVIAVFCLLTTGCTPVTDNPAVNNPAADKQDTEHKVGDLLELELKGVKWKFHWCPAGSFTMGSPESETGRIDNETQHKVTLTQGFYMAETECTQEQWQSITGSNPSNFKGAKLPVEQVSWEDCQEFIAKLNEAKIAPAGFTFTLPTEAQWEYACRAGSGYLGDDMGLLSDYAWYHKNSGYETHEVGGKKPNAWGLYDMHGNVSEVCLDDNDAVRLVCRGGGCNSNAEHCLSSSRGGAPPGLGFNSIGLRIALVKSDK